MFDWLTRLNISRCFTNLAYSYS